MLVTLPTLANTLFKRGASKAEMQRIKQDYLEKYSTTGFDPFAHKWAYGIDGRPAKSKIVYPDILRLIIAESSAIPSLQVILMSM